MASAPSFPTIAPASGGETHSTVISRTSILYKGRQIPTCINAYIDARGAFYTPYKPCMVFEVEPEGCAIGRFSIMPIWDKIDSKGRFSSIPYHLHYPLEEGDLLLRRRLFVAGMIDDLETDPATGSSPVTQVMTQLAVEILSRESERMLEIQTNYHTKFNHAVIFNAGFAPNIIDFIGSELESMGVLKKNSQGEMMTPQDDGPDTPARVAFAANKTWKQVIQERPLLNYAPGPILPVFQNVSAYELS